MSALKLWEEECKALKERMPHVCENCRWWQDEYCEKHDANPPADFAQEPGACPDWKDVVPF